MGKTTKRRKICNSEDKPSEQKCNEWAYFQHRRFSDCLNKTTCTANYITYILKTKLVLAVIFPQKSENSSE